MALTADRGADFQQKLTRGVTSGTAAEVLYRYGLVVRRLATGDGKLYRAVNDTSDTYKQVIWGFALEGATADESCRVRSDGQIRLAYDGDPTGKEGTLACLKDDETVQAYGGATCQVVVGRITEVEGSDVWVDITDRPARLATNAYD